MFTLPHFSQLLYFEPHKLLTCFSMFPSSFCLDFEPVVLCKCFPGFFQVFPSIRFGFYHNNCHDYSKYSVTFHAFRASLSDYWLSLFPSSASWSLYFSKDLKLLNPNCRFKLETFSINCILRIVECIRFKMCPRTLGISMENYFFTTRLRRVLVFEGQLVTQLSCWTLFRILVGVAVSQ